MRGKGVKMMHLIKWITFAAFDPPMLYIPSTIQIHKIMY